MNNPLNEIVIVRTESAGVFFGTLAEKEGNEVKLTNCRRIWYWDGAASVSELAVSGVTQPQRCKFSVPVKSIIVEGVIEIIPCEQKAIESINAVKEWRMSR